MKTFFYKEIISNLNYMAGFDKTLDVELFGEEANFETTKIRVSIMCYNEGQKKLQISRENLDNDSGDWRWSKLGRLTKDEATAVVPLMEKAAKEMD